MTRRIARASTHDLCATLARSIEHVDALLSEPGALSPREIAALVRALCVTVGALVRLCARIDAAAQARLTREKTRAELRLLRRMLGGEHVTREAVTDVELDRRVVALVSPVDLPRAA